jgi:hypothetical protein
VISAERLDDMEEHEPKPEAPRSLREPRKLRRKRRFRLGAVIALAVGGGLGAWAIVDSRGTGSTHASGPTTSATTATTATPANAIGPIGLSAKGLRTLTRSVNQPIYWAGAKPGFLYELTRTTTGKIFIRYLPAGVKVGSKQATYLIVATYRVPNAFQNLKNLSSEHHFSIPGGGIAIVDQKHPQSVHLAYPGINYQFEVYDPSPARSLQVAKSGDVRPVLPQP